MQAHGTWHMAHPSYAAPSAAFQLAFHYRRRIRGISDSSAARARTHPQNHDLYPTRPRPRPCVITPAVFYRKSSVLTPEPATSPRGFQVRLIINLSDYIMRQYAFANESVCADSATVHIVRFPWTQGPIGYVDA